MKARTAKQAAPKLLPVDPKALAKGLKAINKEKHPCADAVKRDFGVVLR